MSGRETETKTTGEKCVKLPGNRGVGGAASRRKNLSQERDKEPVVRNKRTRTNRSRGRSEAISIGQGGGGKDTYRRRSELRESHLAFGEEEEDSDTGGNSRREKTSSRIRNPESTYRRGLGQIQVTGEPR